MWYQNDSIFATLAERFYHGLSQMPRKIPHSRQEERPIHSFSGCMSVSSTLLPPLYRNRSQCHESQIRSNGELVPKEDVHKSFKKY